MVILNDSKQKLELEYPVNWKYKLISLSKEQIQKAIHDVILEREHKLKHSNESKTGKYVSMNLELLVHNEDDRNFIYEALKAHQNIKMVL
ncbi:YbeD family protein [Sulfurimonas sp.]|uniref:HP0495 family protein n=1 Tax=Sulfurimonas sp. TaxID=2022749 RepID=UPI00356B29A2